ncbi:hypothetical protein J4449_01695 [Candidatus Woesearchaeota archaeon]|nr:hypothetical protein [Candidatus Woesearchaeota archaeon]
MSSVQQTVSNLLSKEICVTRNLFQKLINIRALARYLIKKYSLNTSLDSVISSIRRYDIQKLDEDKKRILTLFKDAVISTRNNLTCITLKNFSLKDLTKLSELKGLNFVKGSRDFKIVVDKKDVNHVKDLFHGKIKKIEDDLSEISILLTDKVLKQKGILAEIANDISIHNININEILICPPEFLILVNSKDMVKTHETILGLTEII